LSTFSRCVGLSPGQFLEPRRHRHADLIEHVNAGVNEFLVDFDATLVDALIENPGMPLRWPEPHRRH
jgi:hypothetical protein